MNKTSTITSTNEELRAALREFYGRQIEKTTDLETNACCDVDTMRLHQHVVNLIPDSAREKYLGCGSPIPDDFATLKGITALDLGSGTGVDAMILRFYLGPRGTMIGIDMTGEQLAIARRAGSAFMKTLNYDPNSLRFEEDFIETADSIPDNSVDLVVSNCVVNLSPRKDLVFRTIQRVLKPGGEFFISDIVSDRRVEMADDPVLVAECLGLAPYVHDARDMMTDAGFPDVRIFSQKQLPDNPRVLERGDLAKFYSVVWRGYNLPDLDRRCEDYGQIAVYNGTLPSAPGSFRLDDGHVFETGRPVAVCRNTARMLSETRLARYFQVTAEVKHFGLFQDCGTPQGKPEEGDSVGCC